MEWTSLHHHSTFSFMDGFGTPEQHVARAAELGMNAMALTEHGNVSSHVRLEQAADRHGIKPIFGCELYTGAVDDEYRSQYKWHLTVLAENEVGYRNLLRLVTMGWDEGFYYEPTVSGTMLAEHSDGLIVLSGCSGSKMATDLLGGKGRPEEDGTIDRARATAERFQSLLGDRFYLETQAFPTLERACDINQAWEQISQEMGIPLVATGDIHYPKPEDSEMQILLHAAGRGNNSFESQARAWGYDTKLTSPLTDRDVYRMMRGTGLSKIAAEQSVRNATEIAQRINFRLPKADMLRYPTDDPKLMFRKLLNEGWKYRGFGKLPKAEREAAKARVARETQVIEGKDFIDYFLILSDVTTFAKDSGIPVGPARGSAAASLVCYLLRITEINPMLYPTMFFERFIDESRQDLPDVDLDFDDERRDELRTYLQDKYGADKVGNIGTFTKYRGKNSVVDVARVHQLPYKDMEEFKNLLITRSGGDSRFDATLEDTVEMFPRAKAIWDAYPQLKQAARLEGNMKGMSVHAAGLVISNTPITDTCALYTKKDRGKGEDDGVRILSVDKNDAEYLNLIKADFLGLKTMGMIRIAIELAGMTLEDLYDVPMDEPDVLKAFKDNDVVGIFQFEGRATRLVNKDVSPDNFMELADINALSRPGPLFSGTTHNYIDVKHGIAEAESLHPIVDRITSFTKGQIIYQEQILQIVREIGDFPWTKAGVIRKIISHKKGEAAFNALYEEFEEGANRLHGISPETATAIWKRIVTAGTYAFNVAHAVSYSTLGFWCMYLKVHHPLEFYTAQLIKTEEAGWPKLVKDAEKHGVRIKGAHLNRSGVTWTPDKDDGSIRAGFTQIKGIGEKYAERIIEYREENGDFDGWDDLLEISGIGPAKMEMIKASADNDDPFGLRETERLLAEIREMIQRDDLNVPEPNCTSDDLIDWPANKRAVWMGIVRTRNYQDTIENKRARTGESVEEITAKLKAPHLVTSCVLFSFDDGDEDVYLRVNRFDYPRLKETLESIDVGRDVVIGVGSKKEGAFGISLHINQLHVISPD